ncbi:MAG: hypothetical protein OXC07_04875 [Kistimonas sp.]|nr:hypothetical protein [Kistimonas sp.]
MVILSCRFAPAYRQRLEPRTRTGTARPFENWAVPARPTIARPPQTTGVILSSPECYDPPPYPPGCPPVTIALYQGD